MNMLQRIKIKYYGYIHPLLLTKRDIKVECPICNWKGKRFLDFDCGYGRIYKKCTCPICESHPRHRSFYIYLKEVIPKNKPVNVLHFAPEKFLTKLFRSYKFINYLSADINKKNAMKLEDITNLSFKDNSFEIIFCSHVLEHVINDKKAMIELHRVLNKNGFAIIDVPIDYNREKTYEDFSIKTPQERTKAFFQYDHVRLYGKDFSDKLRKIGFKVKSDKFNKALGLKKIEKFGLEDLPIYFCTK
jgi:SAM-dependent methyltransferase